MFEQRHYEIIAKAINEQLKFCDNEREEDILVGLERKLEYIFRQDNPKFDTMRFRKASGKSGAIKDKVVVRA